MINTSRSGFNPEDASVQALEAYARDKLTAIADGLAKERASSRKKAAFSRNPEVEKRLKALGPEVYGKMDKTLDSVVLQLSRNETDEVVDRIVDLIISYYESTSMRVILDALGEAGPESVDRFSGLLAQYGTTRISEVTEILHSQLMVIDLLRRKVQEGVLENEIHKIVAGNIWLVRNDLQYWFDNKTFGTQLRERLAEHFSYAQDKRPDLVCLDNRKLTDSAQPGRIVVIEFKRPGVEVGLTEIVQVMEYKSVFRASFPTFEYQDVEVIILGDKFASAVDRAGLTYKISSYEEVLTAARARYQDLFDRLSPEELTKEKSSES